MECLRAQATYKIWRERVGEEGSEQKKEAKVTHGKGRNRKKDQMVKGFKRKGRDKKGRKTRCNGRGNR